MTVVPVLPVKRLGRPVVPEGPNSEFVPAK